LIGGGRRLRTFAALRHREFRLLWSGQATTSMAGWMDQVARGWLMYELTSSPLQLGLVLGIRAIPILVLSPVAGSVADHYPRRRLVVVTQAVTGVMYAGLAALVAGGLVRPWHLYAMAVGMSIVQTFHQPARAAMIADAVPPEQLTNAIGLNSIMFNVARSTGPALAGVLIATSGMASCFAVQTGLHLLALAWTLALRADPPAAAGAAGRHARRTALGGIVEGLAFSWRTPEVRAGLLVTTTASLLIMPFSTLLPVFARDLLRVGAHGQGGLLTAMGLGALCSAFLVASLGDRLPRGPLMLGGVTLYGLSVVAFAASPSFGLSLAVMVVVGVAHVSSYALVQTVVQTYSPSAFRGRTMAVFQMGEVVFTLGAMLAGTLAATVGARWAAAGMGAAGALVTLVITASQPQARRIR